MPFGLLISLACHAALLGWAYFSMRAVQELPNESQIAISAEIITQSDLIRLKQGAEDSKKIETKAKDEPKPDDSKNDAKKPDNAPPPPPPPQEVAKLEEPPAESAKAEPPPPPEPPKAETPPPPPEPAPGPTPDEQKLLEQKIEEDRKKAEDEAKKKAEADAKKKAEEEAKKKKAEEERKKKLAEAKKKAEEAKKKFDPNKIANLLDKAPDDAQQKALIDKDPRLKGQQAAGTSQTATETGREAGVAQGSDTVLSGPEIAMLAGMIKKGVQPCWKVLGGGEGASGAVVRMRIQLNQDGSLNGEPQILSQSDNSALGMASAESARRAVIQCQPYRLPQDKYASWQDLILKFDPKDMF